MISSLRIDYLFRISSSCFVKAQASYVISSKFDCFSISLLLFLSSYSYFNASSYNESKYLRKFNLYKLNYYSLNISKVSSSPEVTASSSKLNRFLSAETSDKDSSARGFLMFFPPAAIFPDFPYEFCFFCPGKLLTILLLLLSPA